MELIKRLRAEQSLHFDRIYFPEQNWAFLESWLGAEIQPEEEFSFLDVGGGNGQFTDGLLDRYPNAQGVLLDVSEELLNANRRNPRKKLLCCSADDLAATLAGQRFRLIFMMFVLHHFIVDGYPETIAKQIDILDQCRRLLTADGCLIVLENLPESFVSNRLTNYLIYRLSSSRRLAGIVRAMGSNTAGIGVLYLDKTRWLESFRSAHLVADNFCEVLHQDLTLSRLGLFGIRQLNRGMFLLRPDSAQSKATGRNRRSGATLSNSPEESCL
jgi:ubiquinone/menaquinone biosynthesis C-methylase UbiE